MRKPGIDKGPELGKPGACVSLGVCAARQCRSDKFANTGVSKNSSRKTGTRHHECIGLFARRYNNFAVAE